MRTVCSLVTILLSVDSFKILVYNSQYGHSHSNFMGRIADVLVEAGHNVTSLIPVIDPNIATDKAKSHEIRIAQSSGTAELMRSYSDTKLDRFSLNNFNPLGAFMLSHIFSTMFSTQCRAVLEEMELIERLRSEHYDVMIAENIDTCGAGLTQLLKPHSYILTSSSFIFGELHEEFGVPTALSYNPEAYLSRMNVHSMWDRLVNMYADILVRINFARSKETIDELFKNKFGPAFPSLLEISSNAAYVFANYEPLIDFAAPTISKIVPIGGIGVKKPKNLNEEWEAILGRREKNVLLSFGSMAKSAYLPMPIKMSIIQTIKDLPRVTFIWKYEEDDTFTEEIASKLPNLVLTKWMPQVDLLAHPKLSLFITHAGMGSTQEIAWRGVPGLFVPLFGDQPRNAGMMEYNGLGKVIDKNDVAHPAMFTAAIREVIDNDRFTLTARRMAQKLQKKPFAVHELIVRYTEFAAEFGPSKALRPQSHDMSWIEYNNVDIIIIAVAIVMIIGIITLKIGKRVLRGAFPSIKAKNE